MKVTNGANDGWTLEVKAGDRFMQGVLVWHGITADDDANGAGRRVGNG